MNITHTHTQGRERERERDRQTDRQTDRQRERARERERGRRELEKCDTTRQKEPFLFMCTFLFWQVRRTKTNERMLRARQREKRQVVGRRQWSNVRHHLETQAHREQYLREDIPCCSPLCQSTSCEDFLALAPNPIMLPEDCERYVVPDANVVAQFPTLLQHSHIPAIILPDVGSKACKQVKKALLVCVCVCARARASVFVYVCVSVSVGLRVDLCGYLSVCALLHMQTRCTVADAFLDLRCHFAWQN